MPHMKKLLWMLPLFMVFIQCRSNEKKSNKNISKRNYSINKANAYNDLFLDSMDLVKFIEENEIPEDTANRIISFYNTRNYEFAWFASDGLSEQAMGFASLLNLSKDTSKEVQKLQKTINQYLDQQNPNIKATETVIKTEFLLTQNLVEYALAHYDKGEVKQKELERFVPFEKSDPLNMADSLLNKKNKDDAGFMMVNEPFKLLVAELTRYNTLAKGSAWKAINADAHFKKGNSNPDLAAVKTNLFLAGDMNLDTTLVFDDLLEAGVRNFQKRIGQTPDGKINKQFLKMLNITPADMVKKILINMNRMRWQPQSLPGRFLKVNIPEFALHVVDDGEQVFEMPVVVGKEGHNTVLFSDEMTTIVFSPYWNVPPSIVKAEIVPGMEQNKNYLDDNNMEITGEENGLPVVRQKPGPKNSLGEVKFLFPNSFNIYFHDTPAKWLFNEDARASSHGCIRLGEPAKLAEWLLKNSNKWDEKKIHTAMNSGNEQFVNLKDPVAVMITYYTAWTDKNGFNIREDIYGHDAGIMKKMFK